MEYCLREPTEVAAAQELASRLWFFWVACGFLREGRYYLDRALNRGGGGRPRRWALWACAFVAGSMSDLEIADELAAQCHADAVAAGDLQLAAYADDARALTLAIRGDFDPAIALMQQTLSYYHSLDHVDLGLLRTQPMLGVTLVMRGDLDAALALAPLCEQLCERLGERWQRSYVHYFVGVALRGNDDATGAVRHLTTAIETKHQFHDVYGLIMCFEQLAGAHADLGDGERAARLLGAVEQLQQSYRLRPSGSPFHSGEYQRAAQHARSLLGAGRYETALRQGRAMDLDALVGYVVTSPRSRTKPAGDPLTRRERQVADLVGSGLTNREIAARLVVSVRTAESHVQNVMTKLGFTSRTQLAAWVTARADE